MVFRTTEDVLATTLIRMAVKEIPVAALSEARKAVKENPVAARSVLRSAVNENPVAFRSRCRIVIRGTSSVSAASVMNNGCRLGDEGAN